MRKYRFIACILLACALTLSITACRQKTAQSTNEVEKSTSVSSQDKVPEEAKNPPPVPEKPKEIKEVQGLVLVSDIDDSIVLDLKYATTDNFTGKKVYPADVCLLQKETAMKLAKANEEFKKLGYKIKIWDAYRPVYVQQIFWNLVKDSRFVANPANGGSRHNTGAAVDITLVDMNGNELKMPSKFDDFTSNAFRTNPNIDAEAKKNMDLLTSIMVHNGFETIDSEWWHFEDSDHAKYKIIDVNLDNFANEK